MADFRKFLPITKVSDNGDGTVTVDGVMTSEAVDDQDDLVEYEASKRAIYKDGGYNEWRTLRAMHQPISAGLTDEILCDDDSKTVYVKVRVVDENEVKKTKAGIYKGFSIGGFSNESTVDMIGGRMVTRHTDVDILELSLADRPSNPDAVFTFVKIGKPKSVSQSQASGPAILRKETDMPGNEVQEAVVAGATQEASDVAWDIDSVQSALATLGHVLAYELAEGETDQAAQLQAARKLVLDWMQAEAGEVDGAIAAVQASGAAEGAEADTPAEEAVETPEEEAAETPEEEAAEEAAGTEVDKDGMGDEDLAALAMKKVLASPGFAALVKSVVTAQMKAQITKGGTAVTQAFTKIDDVATRLGVLEKRVRVMAKRGPVAGPVLRAVPAADEESSDAAVTVLTELIDKESDNATRQTLMQRRTDLLIKAVHAGGGNRIGR